jgi:predicted amidohydrolase YtcJ
VILLLVHGNVVTMDATLPRAEALAVKDGRIVDVGGTDEILWLREDDYEVIDLAGRTVLPGFVDPHNHFSIGAFETSWGDCRGVRSVADVQAALAAAARSAPAGEWVRTFGYDHALIGRHPTRAELDAAVPDRPALLMHFSHHQAVVNSRALAEAGITRATPDPPGGEIARDKAGEPTGLLFERAMGAAETRSRRGAETRFVDVARAASVRYAALGITTVQDAAVTPAMARRYAEARAAGALAIDVRETMVGSGGWFDRPRDAAPGPLKLFVDGGYRCALRTTRDGAPRASGFLFYERAELAALLLAAWRAERDVVCHAIGNLGVETAIGAMEDAVRAEPAGRARVRLDHGIFLTRELIDRLAALEIWLVAQPSFLYDTPPVAAGPPLRDGAHEILLRPFATAARAGVRQAFSSDFPCGSNAPLHGIAAAVTRRTAAGQVVAPDEALSAEAAVEAYTVGAARAAGLARDRGSLEAGKRADFLILSADPLSCPPDDIAAIEVREAWVTGRRIFARP